MTHFSKTCYSEDKLMKPFILFASAAIALLPAASQAATAKLSAIEYIAKAGASDMYEINASKLVLAETQDDQLKSFAQMMVDDHTKSTSDVVAAAQADGITPGAPKLMPKQASMIAELKRANGPARDKLYKRQQLMAHQEALTIQKGYATSGDKPNLKAAAATIVPVVTRHLTELKQMTAS